ncbi:type II toxin-antitoxin system RelE family toxin [Methylohalobius crimeensis]|uniref:type II toxin-antitoxin system RelE family toxin n=1 Tax=Methylohalobius crimeensis TaxID=244365 RepID=UPI000A042647
MAAYRLIWKRSAERELRELPKVAIARLVALAELLTDNPYSPGTRKLMGTDHTYRVRTGNYRLVYSMENKLCQKTAG